MIEVCTYCGTRQPLNPISGEILQLRTHLRDWCDSVPRCEFDGGPILDGGVPRDEWSDAPAFHSVECREAMAERRVSQ
jgi:hypothetical protein